MTNTKINYNGRYVANDFFGVAVKESARAKAHSRRFPAKGTPTRGRGNRGSFMVTAARVFCAVLFVSSWYMCHANNSQPATPKTEAAVQQDEEPNSSRDTFPREYMSADRPNGYVEPDVAEDNAFTELMNNESGFEAGRLNKESLACGIGQAYPCTKLYSFATKDWILKNKIIKTMPDGTTKWYLPNPDRDYEISWAKEYIKNRYTNAVNALAEWKKLKPCGLNKKKLCNFY